MADRVLFIGWSYAVRGREEASEKVFAETMEFWSRLEKEGEIESVDTVFLDAHGGDLGGFFLVKGERDKLTRVRESNDMERLMVRANLVVDGLGAVGGTIGDAVARQMGMFLEAAKELG